MEYIRKMICPNGCKGHFIATAHVAQGWYVDELGNYLETENECIETVHSPAFDDIWHCAECGCEAVVVVEPDDSAQECRLELDFTGMLSCFYEGILGDIPDGYQVVASKVRVSKPDFDRILERLRENYRSMADNMGFSVSDDEIVTETGMRMCSGGPGVDRDVKEGVVRLLEGYVVQSEDALRLAPSIRLYMGLPYRPDKLMPKQELLDYLLQNGADDRAISELREQQYKDFGQELIWRYPLSDGSCHGGFIFPVQEGFLWIPYDVVYMHDGELLEMDKAELLNADALKELREEYESYAKELCSVLRDAERIVHK